MDTLERIGRGEERALEELLQECWEPLVRYLMSILRSHDQAKDAAQDALVRIWAGRDQWKPGSARGLLFRLGRNAALDMIRKEEVRSRWARERAHDDPDYSPDPEDDAIASEFARRFMGAMAELPQRRRDDRESWVRPTHLGAWEKAVLGWLDEVERVGDVLNRAYTLEPVQESQRVLKIPLQPELWAEGGGEYLLMEYRTKEGFDQDLRAAGVLVYHVDPGIRGNQPCDSCPQQYSVSLLEADGNNTLRRNFRDGGNRGEPGDAWGVEGPGVLATNTYPSTRLHSGARSPVTIYEIAVDDGLARITLSSYYLPSERLLQPFLSSGATALTPSQRAYVDSHGNANGECDIGDLRAYWMR